MKLHRLATGQGRGVGDSSHRLKGKRCIGIDGIRAGIGIPGSEEKKGKKKKKKNQSLFVFLDRTNNTNFSLVFSDITYLTPFALSPPNNNTFSGNFIYLNHKFPIRALFFRFLPPPTILNNILERVFRLS